MSFCSGCIDLKEIPGSPSGKTEKIAGLDAYVAPGSKKGTIVRGVARKLCCGRWLTRSSRTADCA